MHLNTCTVLFVAKPPVGLGVDVKVTVVPFTLSGSAAAKATDFRITPQANTPLASQKGPAVLSGS